MSMASGCRWPCFSDLRKSLPVARHHCLVGHEFHQGAALTEVVDCFLQVQKGLPLLQSARQLTTSGSYTVNKSNYCCILLRHTHTSDTAQLCSVTSAKVKLLNRWKVCLPEHGAALSSSSFDTSTYSPRDCYLLKTFSYFLTVTRTDTWRRSIFLFDGKL